MDQRLSYNPPSLPPAVPDNCPAIVPHATCDIVVSATKIGSAPSCPALCTNSASPIPIPFPPDEDVEINDRGEFINLFYEVRATFVTNARNDARLQARIRFVFVIVFIVFGSVLLMQRVAEAEG